MIQFVKAAILSIKSFVFRSMNGKFKNLNAVSTLPVWRGKGWERFQKVISTILISKQFNETN